MGGGEVVLLPRVLLDLVELELGEGAVRDEFPVAAANRSVSEVFPEQISWLRLCFASHVWHKAAAFERAGFVLLPFLGVLTTREFQQRRQEIHDVSHAVADGILRSDVIGPAHDKRSRNPAFVQPGLVQTEGSTPQIRPPAAVGLV